MPSKCSGANQIWDELLMTTRIFVSWLTGDELRVLECDQPCVNYNDLPYSLLV